MPFAEEDAPAVEADDDEANFFFHHLRVGLALLPTIYILQSKHILN
jgi:hypothetical protein